MAGTGAVGSNPVVATPLEQKQAAAPAGAAPQPAVQDKPNAYVPKTQVPTATPVSQADREAAKAATADMAAQAEKGKAALTATQELQLKTALESFAKGKTPSMEALHRVLLEVKESNPGLLESGVGRQVAIKFELTRALQQADTYATTTPLQAGEFGKLSALLEQVKELDASLLESPAAQNLSKKLVELQEAISKAPPVDATPGAAKPTRAQEVAAAQKKLTEAAAAYAKTAPQREEAFKLLKEVAAVDVNLLKFGPGKEVVKALDDVQRPMIPKELADLDALTNKNPIATRDDAIQVGMFLNEVQRIDPEQLKTTAALSLIGKLQKAKQSIEAAEAAAAQGTAKAAGGAAAPAAEAAAAQGTANAAGGAAAPAAKAEAAAAEPASEVPETWTIKPGDTLWARAKAHLGPGADNTAIANFVKKVAQENNIADPNKIYPNQVFKLPATEKPAAAGEAPAEAVEAAPAEAPPAAPPRRESVKPNPAVGPASGSVVDKRNENYGNEDRGAAKRAAAAEADAEKAQNDNYGNEDRGAAKRAADAEKAKTENYGNEDRGAAKRAEAEPEALVDAAAQGMP